MEELESLKSQLKTAVEAGSKLALELEEWKKLGKEYANQESKFEKQNDELRDHLTYFRNRASGLNQSTEFTFEKFYWEVIKRLNRIKP